MHHIRDLISGLFFNISGIKQKGFRGSYIVQNKVSYGLQTTGIKSWHETFLPHISRSIKNSHGVCFFLTVSTKRLGDKATWRHLGWCQGLWCGFAPPGPEGRAEGRWGRAGSGGRKGDFESCVVKKTNWGALCWCGNVACMGCVTICPCVSGRLVQRRAHTHIHSLRHYTGFKRNTHTRTEAQHLQGIQHKRHNKKAN